GLTYLAGEGRPLVNEWLKLSSYSLHTVEGPAATPLVAAWRLIRLALVAFPYVALGLSGFELSMAVVPMIRGNADDDPESPRGRIRNMRKLLIAAAVIMAAGLLSSVTVAAILIPHGEFQAHCPPS